MMQRVFAAHIKGKSIHALYEHLTHTAERAKTFAKPFKSEEIAFLAGLWHDLGKYSEKFQRKLYENTTIQVDHSTAGTQWALRYFEKTGMPNLGIIVAWIIAGHHAGLADWHRADGGRASLEERLQKKTEPIEGVPAEILEPVVEFSLPSISDVALWVRMLFSALVDADYLDTELFFKAKKTALRSRYPTIDELLKSFETRIQALIARASDTPVNRERRKIYETCVTKASEKPGIYTLCVPTGGGKTLSSMAFALHHAKKHNKRRIIYVIPYTSIIEQNASVYKDFFGDAVIEHHSQFELDDSDEHYSPAKLAAENWDAPIIVTTTVQFFESLFSNRSSRCRKLHNIAQSVVVIDEVQTLPPHLLDPMLRKIEALKNDYGVTFVLSTATQPDFHGFDLPEFSLKGLPIDGEIIEDPITLAKRFRRTEIEWRHQKTISIEELAQELADQNDSLLCVLNTRDRARDLFEALKEVEKGALIYHLSANMCGKHRFETIEKIKKELADGKRIKVVSTNLIEAGVDLDFPRLYRELAGLESIAQAAGRCNREGKMASPGKVVVFALALDQKQKTPPYLKEPINALNDIFADMDDPLSPEAFQRYFGALYRQYADRLDEKKILEKERRQTPTWPFATVAESFRMIEDDYTQSVLIPYDKRAKDAMALLKLPDPPYRSLIRKLQRYSINLPKETVTRLLDSCEIEEVAEGIVVLKNEALYCADIGFDERRAGMLGSTGLVI